MGIVWAACDGEAFVKRLNSLPPPYDGSFNLETFNFILITVDNYILTKFFHGNNHQYSRNGWIGMGFILERAIFVWFREKLFDYRKCSCGFSVLLLINLIALALR